MCFACVRQVSHKSLPRRRPVSSVYATPRRLQQQQQSTKRAVRRVRSDAATRDTGDRTTTGATGATTAADAAARREKLTSVRDGTGRPRRVQSMGEYRLVGYRSATTQ